MKLLYHACLQAKLNSQQMKITEQNANKSANVEALVEEYKYLIEQESGKIVNFRYAGLNASWKLLN
mgnify:CR=1 FL=1